MSSSSTRDAGPLDFQAVYDEFHARIHRYLERMIGPADCDDATQDVFAKVSVGLAEFRGEASLSTWIYRIATNAAYDRLRSRSSHPQADVPIDDAPPIEDHVPGAEQRLVRREMNDCVGEYIDRLPASYRSVVALSEHEGLTNIEIAETLGVTLEAVKIRLHRARARLRKELSGGCDFYRDDRNEFACQPKPAGVAPKR
jgi:RNA polymerase sigma-70 factor (ECF subfamily)